MTRATIKGGGLLAKAMKDAQPKVEAAMRKGIQAAVADVGRSPAPKVRATQQQLVDCIRRYQRANTRTEMAQADALAERLVGKP